MAPVLPRLTGSVGHRSPNIVSQEAKPTSVIAIISKDAEGAPSGDPVVAESETENHNRLQEDRKA